MKSKTKKKSTEIKNHKMGTGGGPATAMKMDNDEQRIINLIGPVLVDGDPNINESACEFIFEGDLEGSTVEYFTKSLETQELAPTMTVKSSNAAVKCLSEAIKLPSVGDSTASKKRVTTKMQRLNKTVEANEKLLSLTEDQNKLYKRDVEANESKAESLKSIAESLKMLVEHLINKE